MSLCNPKCFYALKHTVLNDVQNALFSKTKIHQIWKINTFLEAKQTNTFRMIYLLFKSLQRILLSSSPESPVSEEKTCWCWMLSEVKNIWEHLIQVQSLSRERRALTECLSMTIEDQKCLTYLCWVLMVALGPDTIMRTVDTKIPSQGHRYTLNTHRFILQIFYVTL